jgi:hypothetical protein
MVNSSCLMKIMDLVESKNLKAMKKWSLRNRVRRDGQKSTHVLNLRKQVRQLLNLVSGNDICEMLKGENLIFIKFLLQFNIIF